MDVILHRFRRVQLHHQIDVRNIESSSRDISGNETLKLSLLESSEGDFSLLLRNITVQDLAFEVDIRVQHDLVAFFLGFRKDDGTVSLFSGVAENDVADGSDTVVVIAGHGQMLHVQRSLIV